MYLNISKRQYDVLSSFYWQLTIFTSVWYKSQTKKEMVGWLVDWLVSQSLSSYLLRNQFNSYSLQLYTRVSQKSCNILITCSIILQRQSGPGSNDNEGVTLRSTLSWVVLLKSLWSDNQDTILEVKRVLPLCRVGQTEKIRHQEEYDALIIYVLKTSCVETHWLIVIYEASLSHGTRLILRHPVRIKFACNRLFTPFATQHYTIPIDHQLHFVSYISLPPPPSI